MQYLLTLILVIVCFENAIGQFFYTDNVDLKKLNIKGRIKRVDIKEKSLFSPSEDRTETLLFDNNGYCMNHRKKIHIHTADSIVSLVEYKYKNEKLECMDQIKVEYNPERCDTIRNCYFYSEAGTLTKKTRFHKRKNEWKNTGYTTYETDSEGNIILEINYLNIGMKDGSIKYKSFINKYNYNSDGQIEYMDLEGKCYIYSYEDKGREVKMIQLLNGDSIPIVYQKYDEHGNELEHLTNVSCPQTRLDSLQLVNQEYLYNPFIKKCIQNSKNIVTKLGNQMSKSLYLTFYQYDELGNIKEKFVIDNCSGLMYYSTYSYVLYK